MDWFWLVWSGHSSVSDCRLCQNVGERVEESAVVADMDRRWDGHLLACLGSRGWVRDHGSSFDEEERDHSHVRGCSSSVPSVAERYV